MEEEKIADIYRENNSGCFISNRQQLNILKKLDQE